MLAAGAAGAIGVDAQVGGVDVDVHDLIHFRHDGDGAGRGVDASLGLGFRHPLHAVAAGLEFQFRVGTEPIDFGNDFPVPANFRFAGRNHFHAPTLALGIAAVHAEQVAGEQGGLVAAGTGADFQEDAAFVVGIPGQQQLLQLQRRGFQLFTPKPDFLGHEIPHFGVMGHFFRVGNIGFDLLVGPVPFDDRAEFGMFARQLAVVVHVGRGVLAGQQQIEFFQALAEVRQFLLYGGFHRI
ncbi:hypothetical protein GALL_370110 [mine drainage metagenome]|uniref:Uncharacterized protein n=1 Tax=mine drainage metagenome TaxID=410659 RepID=A0A1J5QC47_9ZZZZ